MCAFLRWLAGAGVALASLNVCSFAAVTEEQPNNAPPWLAQVPELKLGAAQSFQFRAMLHLDTVQLIVYVAWSPPNHRSVVVCDGFDDLPLIISVDGDTWTYDLIGGQIVHLKSEPQFTIQLKDENANIGVGTLSAGHKAIVDLDLVSFFNGTLSTKADAKGRYVSSKSSRGSEVILQVTPSDPPLPVRFAVLIPTMTPAAALGCDDFHFGEKLPEWHHSLDAETLAKDVPYLDATNMDAAGQSKQEMLQMTMQLLFGQVTFLLRPALRDPELRRKLEQKYSKLDFNQMELHDQLLKKVWLQTLEKQKSNPAKFAPPLPAADK